MSELIDCINNLSAKDIIKSVAKTANGTPFYLQTAGGAFSPADLPDLVLWLDADVGVTVATGVSQWDDQSGLGNHATQGVGAEQPAYIASDANFNGHGSVDSDGVDDSLLLNSALVLSNFSIFFVSRATGYVIGSSLSAVHYIQPQALRTVVRLSATTTFNGLPNLTGAMLHEVHRSSNNMTVFRDGTPGTENPIVNATNTNINAFFMRTTGTYANVEIGEVIVCSSAITGDDLTNTQTYLATKYGITLP